MVVWPPLMDDLAHPVEAVAESVHLQDEAAEMTQRHFEARLEELARLKVDLRMAPRGRHVQVHPPQAGVVDHQRVVAAVPDHYGAACRESR